MSEMYETVARAMHRRHATGRIPDALCIDCIISADAAIRAVIGYLDDKAAKERRGDGDFVPLVILEAWEIVANDLRAHLPASDTEASNAK